MQTEKILYEDDGIICHGYAAYPETLDHAKPAVIVVHDWTGQNEFAREKAEQLAAQGFVGFALDMYGEGRIGHTDEEKTQLMSELMQDRRLLLSRIMAAVQTVRALPAVDNQRIAAIGYCFGGLCVLDLARSGIDLSVVVSFHGLLGAPQGMPSHDIQAKVLVLHGHDDPMVPPEQVLEFQTEMTCAHADWQMCIYGNTSHAFSNPLANNPALGLRYNPLTDERSWRFCRQFLAQEL